MKTFAVKAKRARPAARRAQGPVNRPWTPALGAQRAEIRHILHGPRVQPKLTVGAPDDAYEREADRVADRVMRMPAPEAAEETPALQRTKYPSIQRLCPECEDEVRRQPVEKEELDEEALRRQPIEEEELQRQPIEEEELEEGLVQTKTHPGAAPEVTPNVASRIQAMRGVGRPLPETERAFFEPRFGHDFGQVRVHTDARAAETTRAVNARAFTVGRDIVFGSGQYAPATGSGKRLLAHELTHVVQQRAARRDTATGVIQRQEPATTAAGTVTIGAVAAKCILGAIAGALFDAAIQAILHSIREWTWRFWRASFDYCSIILSAILGCIFAPISAFLLDGWVTARLGTRLGGMAGTLIGKILLFIAKKLAIGIPKKLVNTLAKLGCVSPEQAAELGVQPGD